MRTAALASSRHCYRLSDPRYPDLDGIGASMVPGRWNALGTRVVYAGATFAGAVLEALAHAGIGRLPPREWRRIEIPAGVLVTTVTAEDVPDWDAPECRASHAFGTAWVTAGTSVALFVPSKPGAPIEQAVVLNPAHPDFARLLVSAPQPHVWDLRLRPVVSPRRRL
jgi:RES domain-containing protein